MAAFTLVIITISAVETKGKAEIKSYQDVMKHYLGNIGKVVSELILTLYLAGACIVFLTIVGDSVEPLMNFYLPDSVFCNRRIIILIFGVFFVFPLCLLREVKLLSIPSGFANFGVIYLGLMIAVTSIIVLFTKPHEYTRDANVMLFNRRMYKNIFPQFFMSVPIIAFSFQCHVIIMPIYHELKNASLSRMLIVIFVSISITVAIYCGIGAFGVLEFGDDTNPDILLSWPGNSIIAIIGRVCITITATFSFPMVYFTDRLSIQTLLYSNNYLKKKLFFSNGLLKTWPFMAISTGLFLIILVIAIYVPDIVTAFGFVGSIGAVTLDFFLPSILFGVIIFQKKEYSTLQKWLLLIIPIVISLIALILMIGGVLVTIFKILND